MNLYWCFRVLIPFTLQLLLELYFRAVLTLGLEMAMNMHCCLTYAGIEFRQPRPPDSIHPRAWVVWMPAVHWYRRLCSRRYPFTCYVHDFDIKTSHYRTFRDVWAIYKLYYGSFPAFSSLWIKTNSEINKLIFDLVYWTVFKITHMQPRIWPQELLLQLQSQVPSLSKLVLPASSLLLLSISCFIISLWLCYTGYQLYWCS